MSTYQPPGEPPSYAQPQDPWANAHETGVASAPTDPIPQPPQQAYGQFTPGVAAPSVWTQETVAHGGYEYVPQQRSRLGMYVLVFLAVVVFGGGGGYGAYYLITNNGFGSPPGGQTTSPSTQTGSAAPTMMASCPNQAGFDPCALKVGDCILAIGSDTKLTPCTTPDAYRLLKIAWGPEITPNGLELLPPDAPEEAQLAQTEALKAIAANICKGTAWNTYFGWDRDDYIGGDRLFCMAKVA